MEGLDISTGSRSSRGPGIYIYIYRDLRSAHVADVNVSIRRRKLAMRGPTSVSR